MSEKDKENLVEAFGDAKDMAGSKRGRRVLIALAVIGFLAAVILFAVFRGC